MEKEMYYIIGIVILVAAVGYWTVAPERSVVLIDGVAGDGISGNVVLSPSADDCSGCEGSPVCAVKGQKAFNYPSACAAVCDGARVVYDDVCERIPSVKG